MFEEESIEPADEDNVGIRKCGKSIITPRFLNRAVCWMLMLP